MIYDITASFDYASSAHSERNAAKPKNALDAPLRMLSQINLETALEHLDLAALIADAKAARGLKKQQYLQGTGRADQ